MDEGADEVPDCDDGFLTPRMVSYLEDPAGFEAERGSETASKVRFEIRKARSDALEEFRYLERHWSDWEKEQTQGIPEQPAEAHVDKVGIAPLFRAEVQKVPLHRDTIDVIEEMRTALSELYMDRLFDRIDNVPPEFDSRDEFRRWAEENPLALRPETREDVPQSREPHHTEKLLQFDDVVRLALQMVPSEAVIQELRGGIEETEPWPGIYQEGPTEILETMAKSVYKPKLRR